MGWGGGGVDDRERATVKEKKQREGRKKERKMKERKPGWKKGSKGRKEEDI